MGNYGGSWIPVAFGYLPSKEICSYESFFVLLSNLMRDNLGPTTQNLKKILCDFEKAIHSAVSTVFEGRVKIQGCFFHFSSCIWKKYAILLLKNVELYIGTSFLESSHLGLSGTTGTIKT